MKLREELVNIGRARATPVYVVSHVCALCTQGGWIVEQIFSGGEIRTLDDLLMRQAT